MIAHGGGRSRLGTTAGDRRSIAVVVALVCALVTGCGDVETRESSQPTAAEEVDGIGPNVLLVMLDQWRFDAYGAMGSPNVKTPALDRIASEGMLFTRYTTPQPVCSASRVMLNASVWPQTYRGGNKLEPGTPTLFSELKRAGYANGFVGKWHMTPSDLVLPERPVQYVPPEVRSDIDWFAGHEYWHRYYGDGIWFLNDDETPRHAGDYEPANQVRLAAQFIEAQVKRVKPFFCTLSVGIPHDPYDARGWAMDPATVVLRENVPPALRDEARPVLAEYYGMVSRFDVTFRGLLDHLTNLGVLDDTIVIVTSDHGAMLYSQGERHKRKPWEESLRVPFAIRWPAGGIRAGTTSDALMASIDVMPTLLGLLGLPPPAGLEGIDHSPLMLGRPFSPRDSIYIGISNPNDTTPFRTQWRGVRTADGWTYATSLARPDWLLYDDDADPMQRVNLIDDPAHAAKGAELEALTRRWAEKLGDPYPFPEG